MSAVQMPKLVRERGVVRFTRVVVIYEDFEPDWEVNNLKWFGSDKYLLLVLRVAPSKLSRALRALQPIADAHTIAHCVFNRAFVFATE
jgi:hypothetical protein